MRIDKFLKSSRIIKRRSIAKEACEQGRVMINNKEAKAGENVNIGDIIKVSFGTGDMEVEVLKLIDNAKKNEAETMYKSI